MTHADASPAVTLTRSSSLLTAQPLQRVLQTSNAWSPSLLRVVLGAVIFPHGAQKALGWFGGPGLEGTLNFFSSGLSVPPLLTLLVVAAEFLGSLALIVGLFTRAAAAAVVAVMLGAVALVHWPHGFFMNWFGAQAGEGFEFHLLALGLAVALVVDGGGRYSLDRALSRLPNR